MTLTGYKTYIVAALLGLLAAARYLGYVDAALADTLQGLLLGGAFAALRTGVKKAD